MPELNTALKAVDQLEILVLVDNISDFLTKTAENTYTEKQNLMKAGMKELSGCCLCSAIHGFSLLVKVQDGDKSHIILFDAGPDAAVFLRNIKNLDIDLRLIDATCLSHGHWDHAGGFLAFKDLDLKGKQVPFYAHPDIFVRRGSISGDQVLPYAEIPSQRTLEQMGFEVHLSKTESTINDVFFLSGEIPRTTKYETGFPGHMCWNKEDQNGFLIH